jgi:hypothetical protein
MYSSEIVEHKPNLGGGGGDKAAADGICRRIPLIVAPGDFDFAGLLPSDLKYKAHVLSPVAKVTSCNHSEKVGEMSTIRAESWRMSGACGATKRGF